MTPAAAAIPPIINGQQSLSGQPAAPVSDNGFPMLAVAVIGMTATAFVLVSYYIFVTKCCFRWHLIEPLRRFSRRQGARFNDEPLTPYSPASWQSRGLNELLIREIPTFQYSRNQPNLSSKCVVCLNEFQENDMLRLLPKCSHAFHLDCIDVWLLRNSNCPLCRSAISGRNRYKLERIVAPNSSPQINPQPQPLQEDEDEDEPNLSSNRHQERAGDSSRKFEHKIINKSKHVKSHHVSIMGDEGINLMRERDNQFCIVQPIRRSFSMDSAADRCVYLSVQEILRQEMQLGELQSGGSRSRRSIFSFGHGRVLPY
ncbi:hypothetical protein C2S53_015876 [Perilla frutescens var. hirtella]|uniref:RING-type E3 ubiquitin transferase n=1 Tax=Perilla frutescens var. hirtella TaxID=608512 RepID=A0AAD4J813_PERFH|nr:hypothetical protein C2S53_015876 [Perilla frutescens var. hirtella]